MTQTWELSSVLAKSPAEIRTKFEPQSKGKSEFVSSAYAGAQCRQSEINALKQKASVNFFFFFNYCYYFFSLSSSEQCFSISTIPVLGEAVYPDEQP